jgi:hypothetical protein
VTDNASNMLKIVKNYKEEVAAQAVKNNNEEESG